MSSMGDTAKTLAGRYELGEVIGRGGMGTVYRATDLVLGRSVAVKLLLGLLADRDPTSIVRFEREARAAAGLSHRGVVAVYDVGEDDGTRFIVMELVSGRSLEAILRHQGPLDPERAASIAARVADALAAAHAAGIVHRDIKPANVMVAEDGAVKVLDFGIARAMDATTLTQNAMVLGTAAYMAPEQALGKPADERSDIYALGCVLYALLTGHPPFTGDSAAAVLNQHANVAPPPLDAAIGRASPQLGSYVLQMLSKSPDDRPQTAGEVRDRLTRRPRQPPVVPAVTAATERLRQTGPTRRLAHVADQNRRALYVGGVLAGLVLVIALVAIASGGGSPRTATTAGHARAAGTTSPRTRSSTAASTTAPRTTAATRPATSRSPTTASSDQPTPQTVAGAAGALSALATEDAQSGTIDQPASGQITHTLQDVLNSYATGRTNDVQHQLADLTQHITMLEQQGMITAAAGPALDQAIANLAKALATAAAPAPATQPPGGPPAQPGKQAKPLKPAKLPKPAKVHGPKHH